MKVLGMGKQAILCALHLTPSWQARNFPHQSHLENTFISSLPSHSLHSYLQSFSLLFSSHFDTTLIVCCDSFHGARVGVTALPYKPYWTVEDGGDINGTVQYSGSDRHMLEAIASTLNFTIHVLPVTTWGQVSRESFKTNMMW